MDTKFLERLKDYALNMFNSEISISNSNDLISLYFCDLYCDYKNNKIKVELNNDDNYSKEAFLLSK